MLLSSCWLSYFIYISNCLFTQNLELTSRVEFLETCECRPSCSFNGTTFGEGMMWSPDMCTVCQCLVGLGAQGNFHCLLNF